MKIFSFDSETLLGNQELEDLGLARLITSVFGENNKSSLLEFFKKTPELQHILDRQILFQELSSIEFEKTFFKTVFNLSHELKKMKTVYKNNESIKAIFWFRYLQMYCTGITELYNMRIPEGVAVNSKIFLSVYEAIRKEIASEEYTVLIDKMNELHCLLREYEKTNLWIQVTRAQYSMAAISIESSETSLAKKMQYYVHSLFGLEVEESKTTCALNEVDKFIAFLLDHIPDLNNMFFELQKIAERYEFLDFITVGQDIGVIWDLLRLIQYLENKGIPLTYARISSDNTYFINQGYDISLVDRVKIIIPNDYKEKRRLSILRGANSGGKTAFMRMIGVCTLFAMVGLPSPAFSMMCPYIKSIRTVFTRTESLKKGRLFTENDEFKFKLSDLESNSLLLVNEVFSSTNESDAKTMSEGFLLKIASANLYCVWNTHCDISQIIKYIHCSQYAPLVDENGNRKYIISVKGDTSSLANDIANIYGLQKEQIVHKWYDRGLL